MSPLSRPMTISMAAVAMTLIGMITLGGCSITPLEEVESPQIATPGVPDSLALVESAANNAESRSTVDRGPRIPDPLLVETGPSGAWVVDTDTARLGVHSAPSSIFTLLGVLGPDDGVISTGRSVESGGIIWMEVRWGDSTAWMINAGLAPVE